MLTFPTSESAIKIEGGKEVVLKKEMVSIAAKEEKVSGKLILLSHVHINRIIH